MSRHVFPTALLLTTGLVTTGLLSACNSPAAPPFAVGKKWDYAVTSVTQPGDLRLEGTGAIEVLTINGATGEVRVTVLLGAGQPVVTTAPVSFPAGRPYDGLALPFQSKAVPDTTSTEAVTVPAGSFTAEKRTTSESRPDGKRILTDVWVVADAPPVKVVSTNISPAEAGESIVTQTWQLKAR